MAAKRESLPLSVSCMQSYHKWGFDCVQLASTAGGNHSNSAVIQNFIVYSLYFNFKLNPLALFPETQHLCSCMTEGAQTKKNEQIVWRTVSIL